MIENSYSIAEARNKFAALIHHVEENKNTVYVTRRGHPTAVILSADEYQRLLDNQPKQDFWHAYTQYLIAWQDEEMSEDEDIWADIRDRSTGREENPWQ